MTDEESIQHQMMYIITKKGEDVTLDCTDVDEKAEVNWSKHGGESIFSIKFENKIHFLIQMMIFLIVATPCH